jgi:hypothetical protein
MKGVPYLVKSMLVAMHAVSLVPNDVISILCVQVLGFSADGKCMGPKVLGCQGVVDRLWQRKRSLSPIAAN